MKSKRIKISLKKLTEEEFDQAPDQVKKFYDHVRQNIPMDNATKKLIVEENPYYFTLEAQPSFSSAFKRISNVKQAIAIDRKKVEKRKPKPGTIHIRGTASPKMARELKKLIE